MFFELIVSDMLMNNKVLKVGEMSFNMEDIVDINIYGKRGIVFAYGKQFYEIIIAKPYNAYKYVLYFKEFSKIKESK